MAKRTKVGLIYSYDENWIGGSYYILNIVHALNILPDVDKPHLVIFTESKSHYNSLLESTNYPYTELGLINLKRGKIERFLNKVSYKLVKSEIFKTPSLEHFNIDFLYPMPLEEINSKSVKKVFWIPDLQQIHLPEFFSNEELAERHSYNEYIARHADLIVFSSQDALEDYKREYSNYVKSTLVLNFAVTHPDISSINFNEIKERYQIDRPYFFSPNQFWVHKNHKTVIEACKIAAKSNPDILILFSGKENDYRVSGYVDELKELVKEYNLTDHIKFLGFLPREDQLTILKNSTAVIQPSLFEGWSTVVEDAKAQNKFVILSSLKVHKEQLGSNVLFFDPLNFDELAEILNMNCDTFEINQYINYKDSVMQFALNFNKMLRAFT